jgi:chromosome segregation ATPase
LNNVIEKKNSELSKLSNKLSEIEGMNKTIGTLQERITKLVNENSNMEGDINQAQENLRLSANQNAKIMQELQQYKKLIDQNDQ